MPLAIRTAEIYTTAAVLAAAPGPRIPHYAVCLDTARLYQWIPGDESGADGYIILGHVGGFGGRWHAVRLDDRGADIEEACCIYLAEKPLRRIQPGDLSDDITLEISTKVSSAASAPDCVSGDMITIVRRDVSAYTVAIVSSLGFPIITLPPSEAWFVDIRFDGIDWVLTRAGKMTP